jgi:HlyD family secretion protein
MTNVDQGRALLDLARQTLKRQQELWKDGLTTRQELERAENDVAVREATSKRASRHRDPPAADPSGAGAAGHDAVQTESVILTSPMDGLVTRRNIEQGETAVMGTMNNAGTVLLTIADMSMLEAEVEVDETDIPMVSLGQPAKVTIDAIPDRSFPRARDGDRHSPIQSTGQSAANTQQRQATNFKVVVTVDEPVPDVRPGFTCTAEITTATRTSVLSVPIQSLTWCARCCTTTKATLVHEPPPQKTSRRGRADGVRVHRTAVGPYPERGRRCVRPDRRPGGVHTTRSRPSSPVRSISM